MHKVAFAPEARDDLRELYLFIAERADGDRAMAYVERIETYCRGFANFPERGMRRDDLFLGGMRGSAGVYCGRARAKMEILDYCPTSYLWSPSVWRGRASSRALAGASGGATRNRSGKNARSNAPTLTAKPRPVYRTPAVR